MALRALRLRRTLTALPSLCRSVSSPNPFSISPCSLLPGHTATYSLSSSPEIFHCRSFQSSAALLSSSTRQFKLYKEGDEIDENTILFEGCDYNHWLIVVDFPRDQPKPPAEEMVRTYERICAEGLGVSIEEAKKRIYACSTTTYEGFQVEMTEEESKKFESVPGVVFVLPDSYIDPVNKQYGGDKYENGVITPRPLPIQQRRPRDRNNRGRYDQQGRPTQNWQGNAPYNQRGPAQGDGRNHGPQQGYTAQNYAPQPMNNQSYAPPSVHNQSYAPQPAMNSQSYAQQQPKNSQSYAQQQPMNSQTYAQQPTTNSQNYAPQSPMNGQNYASQPLMNNQNYGLGRRDPYQGDRSGASPPVYQGNFSQGGQRNYYPQEQQGNQQGYQGNVAPSGPGYGQVVNPRFGEGTDTSYGQANRQEANPAYRHGANPGSGQGTSPAYNGQVLGQGVGPSHGQSHSQGANPGYPQEVYGGGQRSSQSEQGAPAGPAGTVQGRL